MICLLIIAMVLAVAALAVGAVALMYALTPITPHVDISKIQWPQSIDPSINVERRSHDDN